MTNLIRCAVAFAALSVGAAQLTYGQEAAPAVDPEATAALEKMSAYLRTLKSFRVDVSVTDEDVLDDGQKIQYGGRTTVLAAFPARLRAEVVNDRHERLYLYDGSHFTLLAKRVNVYATIDAPPTVRQLVDAVNETYGFTFPLEDLFLWGDPGWKPSGITAAIDVGPAVVDGTTCEQYAFRQDDIDWQLWIQRGDYPLPRKLVITTKTDEARPQHTSVFAWDLAPSFNDGAFEFEAPDGASRVVLAGLDDDDDDN
jgi:hypothetical protein